MERPSRRKLNGRLTKNLPSRGAIDLDKFAEKRKPLYIAFRYLGAAFEKPTQRSWSIQDIKVSRDEVVSSVEPFEIQ